MSKMDYGRTCVKFETIVKEARTSVCTSWSYWGRLGMHWLVFRLFKYLFEAFGEVVFLFPLRFSQLPLYTQVRLYSSSLDSTWGQ